MANIKQKYIKPGRDYNYSEGVKVLATAAVAADQIVYVDGSSGPFLKVSPADCDAAFPAGANGRLMIAKHAIAAGSYGIVLPWKLVTTVDTSSGEVGDPVFLSATPGTTVASNLTLTCPTTSALGDQKQIILGRVTVAATIANGGAILVNASSPEVREPSGTITATNTHAVGRSLETLVVKPGSSTANRDYTFEYPIIVVDVYTISAGSGVRNAEVYNATNKLCADVTFNTSTDVIVRTANIVQAQNKVPTTSYLRVTKSGTGQVGDLVIVHFIRG